MRYRSTLFIAILTTLALLLAACGETITPTPRTSPTSTPPLTGEPANWNGQPTMPGGLPDIASVVERVAPAVVSVLATIETRNFFGQVVESQAQGSGVVFDERGYILTNNHVVEDAREVVVTLVDRTRHKAEVVGTDPASDLAVLRIDPDNVADLVTVPLGDTEAMRNGDWVIAIGCPLGLCGSVSVGVVSAKHRQLSLPQGPTLYDLVQTDAVINPGNSGGPLLNLNGEIIGINTAIIRGQLGSGQEAEGIGFAVSMSTALPVTRQIIETGRVERARLGVEISLEEVTPALAEERDLAVDYGVIIANIFPGGGAAAAGLESGDIIVALDDRRVSTFTDLQRMLLADYRPGETVDVTVVRDSVFMTFEVTLGSSLND